MSTSTTLKLALELAAKVTGREDWAAWGDFAHVRLRLTANRIYELAGAVWKGYRIEVMCGFSAMPAA